MLGLVDSTRKKMIKNQGNKTHVFMFFDFSFKQVLKFTGGSYAFLLFENRGKYRQLNSKKIAYEKS